MCFIASYARDTADFRSDAIAEVARTLPPAVTRCPVLGSRAVPAWNMLESTIR
jgi:hypothetical protein